VDVSRTAELDRKRPAQAGEVEIRCHSFPLSDLIPVLQALCGECQADATVVEATVLEKEIQKHKRRGLK
jgi:hypothetical protein